MFEQAKDLHASGKSLVAIAAEIGVGPRTIAKWVEADALPRRRRLTLKPSSRSISEHRLAHLRGRLCFVFRHHARPEIHPWSRQ